MYVFRSSNFFSQISPASLEKCLKRRGRKKIIFFLFHCYFVTSTCEQIIRKWNHYLWFNILFGSISAFNRLPISINVTYQRNVVWHITSVISIHRGFGPSTLAKIYTKKNFTFFSVNYICLPWI